MNPPQGNCIAASSLIGKTLIGEGVYGTVYKATWITADGEREVAIKIMKNATVNQVLTERNRMASLDHDNVVKLLGIVQQNGRVPWLVMEYMSRGDLLTYIKKHRNSPGGLTERVMMKIAWGIARGMEYLHDQQIIHGDLAARNCLIGHRRSVKIGDLGFYDATNAAEYYNYTTMNNNPPCPIPWMPPENLPYALSSNGQMIKAKPRHTVEGDIWAYGVVLFELWSRGEQPFSGCTSYQICQRLLYKWTPISTHNITMKLHVQNLMNGCWQFNPQYRPSFSSAVDHFEQHEGFHSDDEESASGTDESGPTGNFEQNEHPVNWLGSDEPYYYSESDGYGLCQNDDDYHSDDQQNEVTYSYGQNNNYDHSSGQQNDNYYNSGQSNDDDYNYDQQNESDYTYSQNNDDDHSYGQQNDSNYCYDQQYEYDCSYSQHSDDDHSYGHMSGVDGYSYDQMSYDDGYSYDQMSYDDGYSYGHDGHGQNNDDGYYQNY